MNKQKEEIIQTLPVLPIKNALLFPYLQMPLSVGRPTSLAAVEAAVEGSRDKFIQALILDGAVHSIETAAKMADELLTAQAELIPQFARHPGGQATR